jgi:hypothetical protein
MNPNISIIFKKILRIALGVSAVILTALAAFLLIPYTFSAEEAPAYAAETYTFSTVSGGVRLDTISGYGATVVIPDTYNSKPVVALGNSLFTNNTTVTSITIPKTVVQIGDYIYPQTFEGMTNLVSITVAAGNDYYQSDNGVLYSRMDNAPCTLICYPKKKTSTSYSVLSGTKYIGMKTVQGNIYLQTVTFPSSLIAIGNYAFDGCSALTTATIVENIQSIGDYCFQGTAIASVTINSTKLEIGGNAYYNTPLYNSAANNAIYSSNNWALGIKGTLSQNPLNLSSYKGIAGGMFAGNTSFSSITFSSQLTAIPGYAFANCTALTSITLPASVSYLGWGAFQGCTALTSADLSACSSLKEIKSDTFRDCTAINSCSLPSSLTNIGANAFYNSKFFTSAASPSTVSVGNWIVGYKGALTSPTFSVSTVGIADQALKGCTTLTSATIPNTVKYIGYEAFANCTSLTTLSVNAHADVVMGDYAFSGCSAISSLTLSNFKNLGDYAFYNSMTANTISTLNLGSALTSIGNYAFAGCTKILSTTNFTIPASVTAIGYYAFQNTGLYTAASGFLYKNNWLLDYNGSRSSVSSLSVNEGTIGLAACAFSNFTALTSATLPASLKYVGTHAFYNCTSLTNLTFPANIESIGDYAFFMCRALVKIMVIRDASDITDAGVGLMFSTSVSNIYVRPASETTYEGAANWNTYSSIIAPLAEVVFSATTGGSTSSATQYYFPGSSISAPYDVTVSSGYYLDAWKANGSAFSYVPSGNYTNGSITGGLWNIVANIASVPGSFGTSFTYNGTAQGPAVSAIADRTIINSYTGNYYGGGSHNAASPPVNAGGSYVYTATIQYGGTTVGSKTVTFAINKKPFTSSNISVSNVASPTYTGSAVTPATYTVADNVLGTISAGAFTYSVSHSNNINAGSSAVITFTGQGNYTGDTVSSNFTILPKNLYGNVTFGSSGTLYYTTSAHTPTPTVTDTARGVQLTGSDFTYSYSNNINAGSTAVVQANGIGNYTGSAYTYFTINKSNVNIDGADITKTYGESLGHTDITGTARNANNTSVNVAGSWSFASAFNAAPRCSDTGNYQVSFTPTDTSNYNTPNNDTITVTILQKALSLSDVTGVDRDYDGTTIVSLNGGTLSGTVYGDVIEVLAGTAEIESPNVGTYVVFNYFISMSGAAAENYTLQQPSYSVYVTISRKSLSGNVNIASIDPVQYKASAYTPTPAVTDTARSVVLINNIDYSYTYSNNINAGTATVTITGLNNYKDSVQTTFAIHKSDVSVTTYPITKTYGESLGHADISGIVRNVNDTNVTVDGTFTFSSAFNSSPVVANSGTYTVHFAPTDASNYNAGSGTVSVVINRKVITVSGITGVDRPYNAGTTVSLQGGTLNGLEYNDGETVLIVRSTATISSPDVGTYTVTGYTISLDGARSENYTLTQPVGIQVTITPKSLIGNVSIAAVPAVNYSESAYTPTPAVTDTARNVVLSSSAEITYSYFNNVNAGIATIRITGKNNYMDYVETTFTINKSNLLITANPITKTYGESLGDADITGTAHNANFPALSVPGAWSFVSAYNPSPVVADSKSYDVHFTPNDLDNYNVSQNYAINVTVNRKVITVSGITGVDRPYNAGTTVSLQGGTLNGLEYNDGETVLIVRSTATISSPDVGTYTVTGYTISLDGARSENYTLTQPVGIQVTITPKSLIGNATIAPIAAVYYKESAYTPTPAVTDTARGMTLVNNTEFTYSYLNNTLAGTATVRITGMWNYMDTIEATFTIRKGRVSIAPENIVKTYGQSLGISDITGSHFNLDYPSIIVAGTWSFRDAYNASPLVADSGTYYIVFTPTDGANYDTPESVPITLTVNKKVITISGVDAYDREYDGTTTVTLYGGTLNGLVYGDQILIYPGTAQIASKNVGSYGVIHDSINVTLGGARSVNYTLIQPDGIDVVLSPKNLTMATDLSWSDVSVVYDGTYQTLASPPAVADSIQSLVENVDFTYGAYSDNLFAGTAYIAIHGIGNYTGNNLITFEIEKRTIGITYINYENLVYNGYEQTVSAIATNVQYNTGNSAQDVVNLTLQGHVNVNAGNYRVTVIALDNDNYQLPAINYLDYSIAPKNIALVKIAVMDSATYTGSKIRRTPAVYDEQRANASLTQNIDFSFDYGSAEDNINVVPGSSNEGFVTIIGSGNYIGTQTATFDIVPKTMINSGLNQTVMTAEIQSHIYTGNQLTPTPAVNDLARAVTLLPGTDYIYSYAANLNVVSGSLIEGTVTITGINNYTGSYSVSFDIAPKTILLGSTPNIAVADIAPMEYTGVKLTPAPAVSDIARSALMIAGSDFTYDYGTSNQNIFCTTNGTTEGFVTIRGTGNYTGSATVYFDITPKAITASVSGLDPVTNIIELVYNGKYQSIVSSPVGVVQYDIDHATVPVFTVTYANGKPYGVLAGAETYPAILSLDRTIFPNYSFVPKAVEIRVLPKPIAVTFGDHNGLVYDGTSKQISYGFANPTDICRNEQNIPDNLILSLSQYSYTPFIGATAMVDAVRNAGNYTVSVSLSSTNYAFANSNVCTFTVAQKQLTVKAEDRSKYFGDPDYASTFTQRVASGTADGDIYVLLQRNRTSSYFMDYERYGVYPYTGIAPQNNYAFTLAENSGYFSINKRMLNVVPEKRTKIYGDPDPESLAQTIISSFEIKIVFNFVRVPGENAGTYAIDIARTTVEYYLYIEGLGYVLDKNLENESDRDLSINFRASDYAVADWFTISKRPITVYMGEYTKVYGDPDPTNYSYQVDTSNLAAADKNRPLNEIFPSYTITRAEGEDVKAGGYALTLELHNPNYAASMTGLSRLMITKLDIAATYNLNEIFTIMTTKVYDGTNKAAVESNLPDLLKKTGFGVTATFSQKNAGTGLTINLTYKINSSSRGNFVLPADSTLSGGQITKRKLIVSFNKTSAEMVYGATPPEFSLSYSGYLTGDNASNIMHADLVGTGLVATVIHMNGLSSQSSVGTYILTLSNAGNYLNYYLDLSATATVTVLPAPLTIHAGETYVRTADGTRTANLSEANFVFVGLKNDDTVSLAYKAVLDSAEPGNTLVRITDINIRDMNSNYVLMNTSLVLNAIIKPLPVIRISEMTVNYDGTPKAVVPSVKVGDEDIQDYIVLYSSNSYAQTTQAPVNAGTYNVTVQTTSGDYSTICAYSFLTIRKILPQITINGTLTQTYGNFRPLSAKVKGLDFEQSIPVIYPFDLSVIPDAGTYTVTASFEGNDNYLPIAAFKTTVTLTINPRAVSATFTGYRDLVYDGTLKNVSATFEGMLEGDTIPPVMTYAGAAPINAGSYTVTVSSGNPNYKVVGSDTLTFTIAKRELVVYVAEGTLDEKGIPNCKLVYEGFAEGDNENSLSSQPVVRLKTMNSGNNELEVLGGEAQNYEIVFDSERSAEIVIEYTAQSQPSNILYILLGTGGGILLIILFAAVLNRRRMMRG